MEKSADQVIKRPWGAVDNGRTRSPSSRRIGSDELDGGGYGRRRRALFDGGDFLRGLRQVPEDRAADRRRHLGGEDVRVARVQEEARRPRGSGERRVGA